MVSSVQKLATEEVMMINEEKIFKHGDIEVTRTRLIVGSSVYAIRNITKVKGLEEFPGCAGRLVGKKSKYVIMLSTSAGEIKVVETKDRHMAGNLLSAIEEAIVQN